MLETIFSKCPGTHLKLTQLTVSEAMSIREAGRSKHAAIEPDTNHEWNAISGFVQIGLLFS